MNKGASAPDRATHEPGLASRPGHSVSVPCAGAVGIVPHTFIRVGYEIVRVVKAGALGKMWEVERYRRGVLSLPAEWERPRRRKVLEWIALPKEGDIAAVDAALTALDDKMRAEVKMAEDGFRQMVRAQASVAQPLAEKR